MPGLFSPAMPLDAVPSPAACPGLLEMLLWAVKQLLYCRPGMAAYQEGVNVIPLSVICKVLWGSTQCSLLSECVIATSERLHRGALQGPCASGISDAFRERTSVNAWLCLRTETGGKRVIWLMRGMPHAPLV